MTRCLVARLAETLFSQEICYYKFRRSEIGEKRGERRRFSYIFSLAVFRAEPQLTERLEEA